MTFNNIMNIMKSAKFTLQIMSSQIPYSQSYRERFFIDRRLQGESPVRNRHDEGPMTGGSVGQKSPTFVTRKIRNLDPPRVNSPHQKGPCRRSCQDHTGENQSRNSLTVPLLRKEMIITVCLPLAVSENSRQGHSCAVTVTMCIGNNIYSSRLFHFSAIQ